MDSYKVLGIIFFLVPEFMNGLGFNTWEVNLLQYIEVLILGYDEIGIRSNSTIHKLVIVWVIGQKVELEVGVYKDHIWEIFQYAQHTLPGNLAHVLFDDFSVFQDNLVRDTKLILSIDQPFENSVMR